MPVERAGVMGLPGLEEAPRRRRIGEVAAHEDLGEHVAHPQLALKRERVGGRVRRDLEARNRIPGGRRVIGQAQRRGRRRGLRGGQGRGKCGGLSHRGPI